MRAETSAIGRSATCPRCYSYFTLAASELGPTKKQTVEAAETGAVSGSSSTAITATEPAPAAPPSATPAVMPQLDFSSDGPDDDVDSSFPLAMFAFIAGGIALIATQFPYGRIVCVALSSVGIFLGLWSLLLAFRQRLWPLVSTIANVAVLAVALLLPSWLGMYTWLPEVFVEETGKTMLMPRDGGKGRLLESEWLDLSSGSWQRDDVRISLSTTWLGRVALVGPENKVKDTKERYLVLGLRIANVGAARRIDYKSWDKPAPPESPPVRIVDSTGKELAIHRFESGWDVHQRGQNAALMPGKHADDWLVLEAPDPKFEYLHIEFPAWGIGETGDPIKLLVPKSMIALHK